jgi:RNA polymerase sigma-70 factor (ECF subfamily)
MSSTESSTPHSPHAAHLRVVSSRVLPPISAGDAERVPRTLSLDEAYRRFAPYVAAIGVRILGRSDELDDLVQDVFVEATRGIAGLSSPEALKPWIARITVRTAVRRLRRARFFRAVHLQIDDAQDYESLASSDATPEQRALIARVYRALDQLAANDRAAWVVRYVQGETLEQGAELCACSLSTYQRRLRRASELLDKRLPHE